jgi:hypothetical protein
VGIETHARPFGGEHAPGARPRFVTGLCDDRTSIQMRLDDPCGREIGPTESTKELEQGRRLARGRSWRDIAKGQRQVDSSLRIAGDLCGSGCPRFEGFSDGHP